MGQGSSWYVRVFVCLYPCSDPVSGPTEPQSRTKAGLVYDRTDSWILHNILNRNTQTRDMASHQSWVMETFSYWWWLFFLKMSFAFFWIGQLWIHSTSVLTLAVLWAFFSKVIFEKLLVSYDLWPPPTTKQHSCRFQDFWRRYEPCTWLGSTYECVLFGNKQRVSCEEVI